MNFPFQIGSSSFVRVQPPLGKAKFIAPVRDWAAGIFLALALGGCGSGPAAPGTPAGASAATAKPANGAAPSGAKSPDVLAAVPKSVFRTDPQSGRDPFFPGASRAVTQASASTPAPRLPLISYLKLVGIRPGTIRPMALINKTSLAPGEEGNISIVVSNQLSRAEIQKINVRCLEIRQNSVLISIEGEQDVKELHLAQGK